MKVANNGNQQQTIGDFLMNFFLIFIGGGIGSVLRYATGLCIGATIFLSATLAVNACGSLAIGLFGGWSERFGWTEAVRLALTVGLCGGFTTFSTFSKESLALVQSGQWCAFVAYAFGSIALGLIAVALGYLIAKQ